MPINAQDQDYIRQVHAGTTMAVLALVELLVRSGMITRDQFIDELTNAESFIEAPSDIALIITGMIKNAVAEQGTKGQVWQQ